MRAAFFPPPSCFERLFEVRACDDPRADVLPLVVFEEGVVQGFVLHFKT